jgi:drug/metabolite transporter (DMT)-like permease
MMSNDISRQRLLRIAEYLLIVLFVVLFLGSLAIGWYFTAYRPISPDIEKGFVISHKVISKLYYVTSLEDSFSNYMIFAGIICGIGVMAIKLGRKKL